MVTGGIAAYKSCFLARLLMQAGFSVKVAMTDAATHFVSPMTLQVLTGQPVAMDLWGERQSEALDHIEFARWADIAVVAPATANTMAKAAAGIADEIVSALNERRFAIAYQPIVPVVGGQPAMYECLLRLIRPNREVVSAGYQERSIAGGDYAICRQSVFSCLVGDSRIGSCD